MSRLDLTRFDALTFDCFGTLIDWERGILDALQPVLAPRGVEVGEEELLVIYARHEARSKPATTRPIARCSRGRCAACAELGVAPGTGRPDDLAGAIGAWPAFLDTGARTLPRLAAAVPGSA